MDTYRWLLRQSFNEAAVRIEWTTPSRRVEPEVEAAIDSAWGRLTARPQVLLFDGPICRLERFSVDHASLSIWLSQTSYRVVVGTNFEHPEFAARFGPEVMANPLGVSAGMISADGFLVMGRRNGSVAYYPHRVHPFAGSLEARDEVNLFDDMRRELREEVGLSGSNISEIELVGLVEDALLLHPEALFMVRSPLGHAELQRRVEHEEHGGSVAIRLDGRPIEESARQAMTPVARAVLEACCSERSTRSGCS